MADDVAPNMFAAGVLCGQIDPSTPRRDSAGDATHRESTAVSRTRFTSTETANLVSILISVSADEKGGEKPVQITGARRYGRGPGAQICCICFCLSR
jgi:hypothetical protein